MHYMCEICNYFTDDCANFRRHQKSTRHLRKVMMCRNQIKANKNDQQLNGRFELAISDQCKESINHRPKVENEHDNGVLVGQDLNLNRISVYPELPIMANRSEQIITDDEASHLCPYCHKGYSHASSLSRHKKVCDIIYQKEQSIDDENIKFKIIEKNWENKFLKKDIEYLKKDVKLAKLATKLALKDKERALKDREIALNDKEKALRDREKALMDKEVLETKLVYESKEKEKALQDTKEAKDFIKSGRLGDTYHLSVKNFVLQHYPDAPALQCLKDYDDSLEDYKMIHNEECHLLDVLVYHNEKGRLHKYLGDFLKANYKKSDPTKQSIWNSDASRLTYIIKELFDNQDSDWYYDKSGIKTKEKIVKPLLDHLKKMVINHIRNLKVELDELDELDEQEELGDIEKADYGHKYDEMDKMVQLQTKIDGDLADQIIKYIAPMFYLETGNFAPENESVKVLIGSSNQQVKKKVVAESQTKEVALSNQSVRQKTKRRVLSLEEMRSNEDDS